MIGFREQLGSFVAGSRLRSKFALFFIVLAVAPVILLGGIAILLIVETHKQDVATLETQLIDQKIEEIKKFFADTAGVLDLRVAYTQKSEIEQSQQEFLLQTMLSENPAFLTLSFANLDGKETTKLVRGMASDAVELQDLSQMSFFGRVTGGELFMSEVFRTPTGPAVYMSAPVHNRNGDIVEVLNAEVSIDEIADSIQAARIGLRGYLLLVDKNGRVIAGPLGSHKISFAESPRFRSLIETGGYDGLGEKDRYESIASNTAVVGAGKNVPATDWLMLAEWPIADDDATIADVKSGVLKVTLGSILAVLLLAPLFASRLTEPIRKLRARAKEIEQGELDRPIELKTGDELEELGASFNEMAKGLKRLEELRKEFVYIVTHELRAPLTAAKGYISLIDEGEGGPVPENIKTLLDPVRQSVEHLVVLVNDLLDAARAEVGKLSVDMGNVDLAFVARGVVAEMRITASDKNISVQYVEPLDVLSVKADPKRLGQVLINLISNAIKYNKPGGYVRVRHEATDASVRTIIEDNGIGMTPEELKHTFEKFYRVEGADTKGVLGTGLGLYITKELIDKMGGSIEVSSEKNKGTTFTVTLSKA
ncbi:MAG: sensor histidine kinase [Candidatus Taylorbacteria bacterium]|nr:sensor histidine kinase [Candidatus Taylorbacteria bacterium]